MKVSDKQYARALFDLTQDQKGAELNKTIKDFARLLLKHNRAVSLNRIIDRFQNIWNQENSVVKAEIISAHKLNDKTKEFLDEHIKKLAQAKEVAVDSKVDPGILGGLIIKYGDRIIDAGFKSKLRSLKQSIQN